MALGALIAAGCGAKTGLVAPCIAEAVTETPDIVFVLDRSGSTGGPLGARGLIDDMKDSVEATLNAVGSAARVGVVLYPDRNTDYCDFTGQDVVAPSETSLEQVRTLVRSAQPGGMTPTFDALNAADRVLRESGASGARRQLVVLATDGGAQCNPSLDPFQCDCSENSQTSCRWTEGSRYCLDPRPPEAASMLVSRGVPTAVIGLGVGLFPERILRQLTAVSQAGGSLGGSERPYFLATQPQELTAILRRLVVESAYCTLRIEGTIRTTPRAIEFEGQRFEREIGPRPSWTARPSERRLLLSGSLCEFAIERRARRWNVVPNDRCDVVD
ncbi:MAG: VWA domain-containing protein [Myxococcales bacterium]|nr:VWA domain-containing protein [Myxococcales bacterium]